MSEYNEDAVKAFVPVKQAIAAFQLPLMMQRRYNGIAKAIVMQVEDGPINKTVITHLRAALMVLADGDGISAVQKLKLAAAFDRFEAQVGFYREEAGHWPD